MAGIAPRDSLHCYSCYAWISSFQSRHGSIHWSNQWLEACNPQAFHVKLSYLEYNFQVQDTKHETFCLNCSRGIERTILVGKKEREKNVTDPFAPWCGYSSCIFIEPGYQCFGTKKLSLSKCPQQMLCSGALPELPLSYKNSFISLDLSVQLCPDEYMTEWETEQFTALSFSIFNFKRLVPLCIWEPEEPKIFNVPWWYAV